MSDAITVHVKLQPDQHEAIRTAAAKVGLTIGPYLRMAALRAAAKESEG